MQNFITWSSRHPWPIVVVVLIITLFAGNEALKIRLDASTSAMMIQNDPALDYYNETLDRFGTDNITVIYVRDPSLFTPEKLEKLDKLVFAFEDVKGVTDVESLFSVTNFKGVDGFLNTSPLMDWVPEDAEESEQVKSDALRNPILRRDLVAEDGQATAINLFVKEDIDDPEFALTFAREIERILGEYENDFDDLFQLGMTYTQWQMTNSILGDQMTLVPLSVAVLMITLVVSMRSLSGAKLPIISAGTSVIWTAGFMGYFGVPLNMLTVIVPSLIIVIGSTEDMHILAEYLEGMEHNDNKRLSAVDYMAEKVGTAVMLTALTTFLGFLSITLNDITMLKQFGIVSAVGLFVNPILTCLLIPVYLRFFGPLPKAHEQKENAIDRFIYNLGELILSIIGKGKMKVLSILLGGAVLIGACIVNVNVDNDMLGYFKPSSDIRLRNDELHEQLSGGQVFFVRISAGFKDAFKQVENLKQVEKLQNYMRSMGVFDKTTSIADQLSLIHREMNDGNEEFYRVPDNQELIPQYLLFLHRDDVKRLVTSDFSEVNILVRHNLSSSYELNEILVELDAYMKENISEYFRYGVTGQGILINKAADSMAKGQAQSLSLLLVIIFIIMSVLFVNVKAGFLSLIPNAFPIVINFGVMGLLGIPLNTGTAMVAAIAIGIAVDDTIHFMSRYNKEMRDLQDQDKAMQVCIRTEIRPVFSTTIALALGFAILGFSSFVPVIYLGLLSAMVMVLALIGDMFVTPILLSSTQLITLWDMVNLRIKKEKLMASSLFKGLKAWQIKKVVLLGRMVETTAGDMAVTQGAHGNTMYLILEGKARVFRNGEDGKEGVTFATFGSGDVFGEIALVEPGERSSNVQAEESLKCLELDMQSLMRIQRIYPRLASRLFQNLSRILGARLVATGKMVAST